jgi:hypothetical protein
MIIYNGQPHHDGEWSASRSGLFTPRQEHLYPLYKRLGGPQDRSGRAWFQASAAKYMKTALFWVITQRVVVISYRRFGTTYWSHLQGSKSQEKEFLTPYNGTDRLFRNVGRKLPRRAQLPVWTRIRTPFQPPRSPIARPTMPSRPIAETVVERTWRKLRAPYNFSRMLKAWQLSAVCCVRHREHRRCYSGTSLRA